MPVIPPYLKGEAAAFWKRIVPGLVESGLVKDRDAAELTTMCEWWARYRKFGDRLDKAGEDENTYQLMLQVGICHTNFDKVASRFGLTPSDRAKLRAEVKPSAIMRRNRHPRGDGEGPA